jgi:hypothetical protein
MTKTGAARAGLLAAVAALALTAPAAAAPRPRGTPPPPREDVRETIQVLMIVSMKQALDLSQEQELVVVPRVQELFTERERFSRERREALGRLQRQVQLETIPDEALHELVLHLDELEIEHRNLEAKLRREIDRSLNPRQQAQLRIFVPNFRAEMRRRIDQARALRETPRRPPAPPRPLLPEWWEDEAGDEF